MIDVVLIDDEIWILKLIKKIVDWNELGFNIVGEAHDGNSGLEIVKKCNPQLIITDILMPGLDGIGLIKAVRELQLKTEFIIISGYSDFEYARSALSYAVFGYLLKPIDQDSLTEMLVDVRRKILSQDQIVKKIEHSKSILLENVLMRLLTDSRETNEPFNADYFNNEHGLLFQNGLYKVVLLKFDTILSVVESKSDALNECVTQLTKLVKFKLSDTTFNSIVFYGKHINLSIFWMMF
jgi:two-component system response regulator YesN